MRTSGHIPGFAEGAVFADRHRLSQSGVHAPPQAGISGAQDEGADSVVLSGGSYEDDEDFGDEVIYTGHGGCSLKTGQQVADQTLTLANLALARNWQRGLPVRLVRGFKPGSRTSPLRSARSYRYDGLFRVADCWCEPGRSGHLVWRFRLVKLSPDEASHTSLPEPVAQTVAEDAPGDSAAPRRVETTTLRVIRDTAQGRWVKKLYDWTCQMCGERLEGIGGPYAEAAHVRPLGRPHDGPDTAANLLCLCPNHHSLLDYGGVGVADDLTLIGMPGRLRALPRHRLDPAHLRHHRERFGLR